jgi:DNA/RNA-binding domain of Phe-tRNA-synthetase-like protein
MTESAVALSVAGVLGAFPQFRVAFALVEGLSGGQAPGAGLGRFCREAEEAALSLLAEREIAELPEIAAWRQAYRAFGCKKTSYRNSCEALLRRLRSGGELPRVLPLVDLYNAISVRYLMPAGADDLAYLAPPMSFRFCRPGDSFLDLAKDPPRDDPPASGEVIYADSEKTLCRRWNWRQDARSRIREETSQATVVIQTLEDPEGGRLEAAAAAFAAHVSEDLGARCRWAIADRANPEVGPV